MTEIKRPSMKDGVIKRGATYSYVVRERDPQTGKTKPRWFGGFPTAKAAKAARDKARVNVAKGTYVPPSPVTLGEWLDLWLAGHAGQIKPSTEASYRSKIDLYLKPTVGAERLQSLSPARLSALFRRLSEAGGKGGRPLSARSVQYVRAILRKALADAVVDRVLEVNPAIGSKAVRSDGKPKHITWTAEQQAAFVSATESERWAIIWLLALATGMRRGELCGLRWSDVDLDGAVVAVNSSVTQIGGKRVASTPKNHERRKVAIDQRTRDALKVWRKFQAAERLEWGPAYVDTEGLLFTWQNGAPVMPDYLTKEFTKAITRAGAGLPRMTLHGTRHTHATTLLREGVPVHVVSKRLGHKDPSVTLNVYADAIPEDDDRAVAVFSRAVWGA